MSETPVITVDIVSDVVCPWCIIGYKKLEKAMLQFEGKARFELAWHAFELNPSMPPEGQDINEHMAQKYGATPEQSKNIGFLRTGNHELLVEDEGWNTGNEAFLPFRFRCSYLGGVHI